MPQATNDPTKFFVLSVPAEATPNAQTPAAAAEASAPAVRLRPVELPSYLRSRPMVVRRGPNEISFQEYARWGEPLEQGIARVVREELLARGAAKSVDAGGLRPSDAGEVKYVIGIRVLACEGNANGTVNFEASWEIAPNDPNAGAPVRGDYHPADLKWSPRHDESLAAAISHAVAGLADEIAAALPKAK